MKKLMKKVEDLMVAVTFAEAGEYDEASRLSGSAQSDQEELHKPAEGLKKTALESADK